MTNVTIYTTAACQYCILAKRYLTDKNITFLEADITHDPAKVEELVAKTGKNTTPVFLIEKDGQAEYVSGFDKGRIDELLGIVDD